MVDADRDDEIIRSNLRKDQKMVDDVQIKKRFRECRLC